jgi:RHS repeat-associated protein
MTTKHKGRSVRGRFSALLCLAVLAIVVAASVLTYSARPAYAQTTPLLQGGWGGARTQTGTIPPGLTANSSQTLTLYQTTPGGSVVGSLATWWPGTPYYWTSYVSGTISGSTMSFSFTPTVANLPAGDVACGENLSLTLATSGGVTTATVPSYHPCGGTNSTINSYAFTLTGWGKQFGGDGGPSVILNSTDVSTGNMIQPTTDYETAGPNKLSLIRYYNSYSPALRIGSSIYTYVFKAPNFTTNYDLGLQFNTGGTQATAIRADGQQLTFKLVSGVWTPDTDVDMVLVNTSGSTWTLTTHDDTVETYNVSSGTGVLTSIKARNGYTQTIALNGNNQVSTVTDSYGRQLTFNYTAGYLTSVNTPDSLVLSYSYSSSGINPGVNDRIAAVSYNTSPITSVQYNYANSSFPFNITSVTDENSNTWQTYTFDSYGRCTSAQDGTGTNANLTTFTYNDAAGTVTIQNALGQKVTNTFGALQGVDKLLTSARTATTHVAAASESFTYDSNGYVATAKDWNGNTTAYTNNAHGDPTTIVEASGTSIARTTTIAYDPTWVHLPDTITTTGLTTGFTYDTSGNPLTQTLTDTTTQSIPYSTNGQTRTTNFTWNNFLPKTIQTPNGNTTTFTFDSTGALTNLQNALLQNTQITSHTGGGLPLTMVDANGVTTTLSYSPRNWLLTKTVATSTGNLTTTNTYDSVGNLTQLKQSDGSYLNYAYDTAHRRTSVTDSFGNSIDYTLDALGDRTVSNVENPSGTVTRGHTSTYDTLGRVFTDIGGMSQTTEYLYDSNSNVVDYYPPGQAYVYLWDQLNRWTRMTFNPAYAQGYNYKTYDSHDRLLTHIDQLGHTTSYVYDGFGDVIQVTSPDTGTAVYYYDSDGNLTKKVDAASITMNLTYDALDRVLTTTYPADTSENVSYTYDQTGTGFSFGIGRLTSVSDMAGSLTRAYDERGNLLTEKRVNGSTTLTTSYTYDGASRVLTITYPDNSLLTYTRDAMGRITAVSDKPSGASSATTLASSITYEPFGPWAGMTLGNSITETPTWDADYRLTALTDIGTATVQSIGYTINQANATTKFTDNVTSSNTLNVAAGPLADVYSYNGTPGNWTVGYDLNLNRQSLSGGITYTQNSGTNQLATIKTGSTTNTVATNANGNISAFSLALGSAGVTSLSYNNANRLTSVSGSSGTLGSYVYDAFGQRFSKTVGSNTTVFKYSPGGLLLAETTGGTETNYIYLNGRPLAMLTGTTFTWLHDDNLGTPRVATNASQTVVWRASYLPFGETVATSGTVTQNLRFPGQYYDAESGFNHNGFRDYVPSLGRYLEADPIGIYDNLGWLNAGMNPYNYVGADPMRSIDPWGLHDFGGDCYEDTPGPTGQYKRLHPGPCNPTFTQRLWRTFHNSKYWAGIYGMTGNAFGFSAFAAYFMAYDLFVPLSITAAALKIEAALMGEANPAWEAVQFGVVDTIFDNPYLSLMWSGLQFDFSLFPTDGTTPLPPIPPPGYPQLPIPQGGAPDHPNDPCAGRPGCIHIPVPFNQ